MNLIGKLVTPESIGLDVVAESKQQLFEQVGALFETLRGIPHATVRESLLARERLGSTGLGRGIAIPHGRVKQLRGTFAVFVRLRQAIAFDAPDSEPVKLLFVVLVPDHATETHLQILSELAPMFIAPAMREALASCAAPAEAYRLLCDWSVNAPA